MTATPEDTRERFTILCPQCRRTLAARAAWVGREVQCPHCKNQMRVPPPMSGAGPVLAAPAREVGGARFQFRCPCCESMLEARDVQSGRTGNCPTCGAQFLVPELDRSGVPYEATLIDHDPQDPTPLHAYGASGHQAPRIFRQADGTPGIECPRCRGQTQITADNCPRCGAPFTIDGVTTGEPRGQGWGSAALILGLIALPLFAVVVPAAGAVVLAGVSWLRAGGGRPGGAAILGAVLGVLSLGCAALFFLT